MKSFVGRSESPPRIHLYREPSSKSFNLDEIADYLREKLGKISVDVRDPLFAATPEKMDEVAGSLAATKVRDVMDPNVEVEPLPGEVEFEKRLLREPGLNLSGVLYDGFKLEAVAREFLPADEANTDHLHVIFTSRLFGTYDEDDGRYHARVSVYGFPSLISTTGIVEAPAKPKEYYSLKQRYMAVGDVISLEKLKERFAGRFIDYEDPRTTEVMKGYVMQAVFYHLTFDPFCQEKKCRMFNSHWQEELLEAQLGKPEFCERHARMLVELKSKSEKVLK
jgi:hypothetical protein